MLELLTVAASVLRRREKADRTRTLRNPYGKRPGRPKGPLLRRIDDEQEFISKTGHKVVIRCLPRETRCRTTDHVHRITEACHRLRMNNVKVTVKHIRMMGIGAGTFFENKEQLPDDIKDELMLSSRRRPVSTTRLDIDEKTETETDEEKELVLLEEADNQPIEPCVDKDCFMLDDGPFIEGSALFEYEANHPALLAFDGVQRTKALDRLLDNENFRNAVLIVDGALDYLPRFGRDEAIRLASVWIEEVKKQRALHNLPLVNMRRVTNPPRPLTGQAVESHKNIF